MLAAAKVLEIHSLQEIRPGRRGGESEVFTFGRLEEVDEVIDELLRVVRDEAAVVHSRVNLVRLDCAVHFFPGLLRRGDWARSVVLTEEEAERSLIELAQVVQVSLGLARDRSPVAVRVALEAAFFRVLSVVQE